MAEMLFVFLHGRRVGTLRRAPGDGVEFRYDPDALEDISISLPAGPNRVYSPNRASAFFNGLLPDGADARLRMARSLGSLDTSTYSLLSKAGLDCAGAVQVWVDDELPARYDALMPVDETRIGLRLRGLLDGVEGDESRGINERWSLSGAQSKIALRSEGGDWFIPLGNEPSTHIIKPGVVGMQGVLPGDQALAEHVTMTAARSLGVDVAMSFYFEFDGVPAIVVERFDRERDSSHQLVRVHQEDMCQALGVGPAQKYEEDGGPSAAGIGALLREVASTPGQAQDDLWRFGLMVAFNYLAEAPDAHAKNFSILHTRAGLTRLAPMYDAATGAIARNPIQASDDSPRRRWVSVGPICSDLQHRCIGVISRRGLVCAIVRVSSRPYEIWPPTSLTHFAMPSSIRVLPRVFGPDSSRRACSAG